MKILEVKQRSVFGRLAGIEYWRVTVENDQGKIQKLNCWAGTHDPSVENLIYDIQQKTGSNVFHEYLKGKYVEGIQHVELAIEGRVKTQVQNNTLVIHVQQKQNSNFVAQGVKSGLGISYGK